MSVTRRRLALREKKSGYVYFGDTPLISRNANITNLVTLRQPAGSIFNYVLVLSKDRTGYKQIAYTQDTLTSAKEGKVVLKPVQYFEGFESGTTTMSFQLTAREKNDELHFDFVRGTGGSGNYFVYHPQVFEVYGLMEPYEEGRIK